MSRIFISYRREDAPGHAGRLFDRLRSRYQADRVFMDMAGIEAGTDFVEAIEAAVGSCDVLLAIIGPQWVNCTDSRGGRRLDDPNDFVRLEVASSLRRNIRVIPVLVLDTPVPRSNELPEDLQGLTRRQAVELRDSRWDADVDDLIAVIDRILSAEESTSESTPPARHSDSKARSGHSNWGLWSLVGILLLGALGLGAYVIWRPEEAAVVAVVDNAGVSVAHGTRAVNETPSSARPMDYGLESTSDESSERRPEKPRAVPESALQPVETDAEMEESASLETALEGRTTVASSEAVVTEEGESQRESAAEAHAAPTSIAKAATGETPLREQKYEDLPAKLNNEAEAPAPVVERSPPEVGAKEAVPPATSSKKTSSPRPLVRRTVVTSPSEGQAADTAKPSAQSGVSSVRSSSDSTRQRLAALGTESAALAPIEFAVTVYGRTSSQGFWDGERSDSYSDHMALAYLAAVEAAGVAGAKGRRYDRDWTDTRELAKGSDEMNLAVCKATGVKVVYGAYAQEAFSLSDIEQTHWPELFLSVFDCGHGTHRRERVGMSPRKGEAFPFGDVMNKAMKRFALKNRDLLK